MPDIAQLAVKVTPQGITTTDDQLDKLGRTAEGTEKRTKSMMDKFRDLQSVMQGPVAAARAVSGGLQQIIRVGSDLVNSYKVQEQAVSNLNAVLAATGGTVGLTSQELQDMASSLQSVTTFGDEAIIGMNAVLLGFRSITGDQFTRTTEAILDMSQVMGQDLVSSANMLGKALDSPTQGMAALSRVGFVWTEQQREMVKAMEESGDLMGAQEVILGEVEKAFGGAARAAGDTATGAFDQLTNSIGDLKEALGQLFVEQNESGIRKLTSYIGELTEGMGRSHKAINAMVDMPTTAAQATEMIAAITAQMDKTVESIMSSPYKFARTQENIDANTAVFRKRIAELQIIQRDLEAMGRYVAAAAPSAATSAGTAAPDNSAAINRDKIAAEHIKEVTDAMNERLRVAQLEATVRGQELTEQEKLNILYSSYVDLVDPAKYVSANNSAARALEARINGTRALAEAEVEAERIRKEAAEKEVERAEKIKRAVEDLTEKYKTHRERIEENLKAVEELWQGGYLTMELYGRALRSLNAELEESTDEMASKAEEAARAIESLLKSLEEAGKSVAIDSFKAIGAALAAGSSGAETFQDYMRDMASTILQQLPLMLLNAGLSVIGVNLAAGLALIGASGLVAIGAGAVSYAQSQASSGVTANALGGVYSSPSLSAYSGGVYDSPQLFAFARGGVFAEAGAEAIMPLERDASGRLGVSASGSGASVEVIINNMAPGTQVTQEERTGPDGTRQVVATVKSIVKSMGRDGELDGVMGRYGLSPQGVRR